jgi:hypothetical protein
VFHGGPAADYYCFYYAYAVECGTLSQQRLYILCMRVWLLILSLYAMFALLYTLGEFLSCYYMLSGSSGWCEPLLRVF